MSEPLFIVHARCKRDPLAIEMTPDKRAEHHLVSKPMPRGEALLTEIDWRSVVKASGWVFTIEPATNERKDGEA